MILNAYITATLRFGYILDPYTDLPISRRLTGFQEQHAAETLAGCRVNSISPTFYNGRATRLRRKGSAASAVTQGDQEYEVKKENDVAHRVQNTGSSPTLAFSCGARAASELMEKGYLRTTLSRRQLQGFVRLR